MTSRTTTRAMTPPEAAKVLRVSADKIVAWIRSGELVAVNVASKQAGGPAGESCPGRSTRSLQKKRRRRSPQATSHDRHDP